MFTLPRWGLAVLAVAGSLIGVLVGVTIGNGVDQSEIEKALIHNCHNDRKFRAEYQDRAIAEKASIQTQIKTNEALIEVTHAFPDVRSLQVLAVDLDRLNKRLVMELARIDLLPLPVCE